MSKSGTPARALDQTTSAPADFAVVWDDPRDAKITWMLNDRDRLPVAPLTYAVVSAFLVGGNAGFKRAGLPFDVRVARINTYGYVGIVPTAAPPEVVMKAMGLLNRAAPGMFKMVMTRMTAGMSKQQEDALNPTVERLESYWLDELLPEIKQHIAYFESTDPRGLNLTQLSEHLAEALRRVERMGDLHGVILPGSFAMSQFEELYRELFEGATTLDAMRLLQGFDNKTLEGDRALWYLSRDALATPEVREIFFERAPADVLPALEDSEASQPFLAGLHDWLAHYGQRLNSAFALVEPSWIEDPTPALEYLRSYLAQAEPRPELKHASSIAAREEAVAEARARLAGYPEPVVAHFETLLKAAQIATVIHEDHNHWIDQRLFYHVRQLIMAFGKALVEADVLDAVNDVFYLTPDELTPAAPGGVLDAPARGLVHERKAEMERFGRVTPPPTLGAAPAFDMGDGGPMVRAMFKGEMSPRNTANEDASMVKGLAGSAGVVRGRAKVVRSLAEAGKLQPGDILVAVSTVPPWTPLFATAAAVVTDTGGVLSHSAVVAREYRIPAVVGTGNGSTTFKDGQLLEVNGTTGTVRVVAEAAGTELSLAG